MGTYKPRFSSEYAISVVKDQYMTIYCICLFFSRNSGGVLCCGIILKTIKCTDCTRGGASQKRKKKHCTSRKRTKIIVGLVLHPIQNQHSDGLICLFVWIIYLLKYLSWSFIQYQINWILFANPGRISWLKFIHLSNLFGWGSKNCLQVYYVEGLIEASVYVTRLQESFSFLKGWNK